jgi:hypothetical protein
MEQRKWTPPPLPPRPAEPAKDQFAAVSDAFAGAGEFVLLFIGYMLIYGLIGLLLSSTFPIGLGLLFFFTRDELIEGVLRKSGIRVEPGSFGWEFIKAFVFFAGWSILLSTWKTSMPQWLQGTPLSDASWPVLAGIALACAALSIVSKVLARKLLPRIGIASAPGSIAWSTAEFVIGLGLLGIVLIPAYLLS